MTRIDYLYRTAAVRRAHRLGLTDTETTVARLVQLIAEYVDC